MRSILAGLRQLVVPWGSRTAPRIVIGGEDPIAVAAQREAAIVFYVSDTEAFVEAVNADGSDFPIFSLFTSALASPFTARVLDVTYQLSTQRVDTVEIAADNVGSLQLGVGQGADPGAGAILIGRADGTLLRIFGLETGFAVESGTQVMTGTTAATTSSAVYANIPGAPTVTVVKTQDSTRLGGSLHVSAFVDAIGIRPEFGVQINGVDYPVCGYPVSQAVVRTTFCGVFDTGAASLPAGSYTCTPRWRKQGGPAGNVGRAVGDENCSVQVWEMQET